MYFHLPDAENLMFLLRGGCFAENKMPSLSVLASTSLFKVLSIWRGLCGILNSAPRWERVGSNSIKTIRTAVGRMQIVFWRPLLLLLLCNISYSWGYDSSTSGALSYSELLGLQACNSPARSTKDFGTAYSWYVKFYPIFSLPTWADPKWLPKKSWLLSRSWVWRCTPYGEQCLVSILGTSRGNIEEIYNLFM